jgi:hypothetical protein
MLCAAAAVGLSAWLGCTAPVAGGAAAFRATAGGLSVQAVKVDLTAARVEVRLAWNHVGRTQSLGGIAQKAGAVAAINGCFFEAYTSLPYKNPGHTLVAEGRVIHKGDVGTFLGFGPGGRPHMGRVACKVVGALDGSYEWPNNWYANWINRYPEGGSTVTVFDRWWGDRAPSGRGFYAVVKGGIVRWTGSEAPAISRGEGDYVVYFSGCEERLGRERFRCGRRCSYRVEMTGGPADEAGGQFASGLACGPRLLRDGRVAVAPQEEGFRSPKILTERCSRSAVGYSRDGRTLVMFTTRSATVRELAEAARGLGLCEAMNLDGGASSGLWCDGGYLVTPGREISNALVVLAGTGGAR